MSASAPIRLGTLPEPTTVSVVMAIKDEAANIEQAIDAILTQTYSRIREIVVAVAPSSDGTDAICRRLEREVPEFRVIANPKGWVSSGLNAAIAATTGHVIVRVDGHCHLPPKYVEISTETLRNTGAAVVGGIQRAVGVTPFQRAVAAAMSSRAGVGNAHFHFGGEPGPTDTVFLGVFRREALDAVAGYNESLLRNQDYDLNWRIREAGGIVWFTPELAVDYQPRDSIKKLGSQYFQYGWWKRIMLQRNPKSLRARQAAPPLLVLALLASVIAAGSTRRPALLAPVWLYAAGVTGAGLSAGKGRTAFSSLLR